MALTADDLLATIKSLPDTEKLKLVDEILTQLDKPDPEIDKIWADEARKRWEAYKAGKIAHEPESVTISDTADVRTKKELG
jgi:restriction endonuclease S subunit